MKGLNIKKLAAVATGAAMVGAALAPLAGAMTLSKSDIYAASGSPAVSVVVGSHAMVSDAVWAGNIATKIAEKAYVMKTVNVSGEAGSGSSATVDNIEVELSIGGTVSYSNAKIYKTGETERVADLNSYPDTKEFPALQVTHSHLDHLYYDTTTYTYNSSKYTRTFQEYFTVSADARFDYENGGSVSDFELYFGSENDLNYTVHLGTGIPAYETSTSATKFTDGTNDNIRIPWFGELYLVREVDTTGSSIYVKLIKEESIDSYNEGETITGLKGKNTYDGQEMSVKVAEVVQTGAATTTYSATFELYDAEGNKIDTRTASSSESLEEQFIDSDGEYVLDTIVYVESINMGAATGVATVRVTIGTNMVQLYDNKGYPYDSTDTSSVYDYKVKISTGSASGGTDNNFIKTISVVNANEQWDNSSGTNDPLYAPSGQALTEEGKAGTQELGFLQGSGAQGEDYVKVKFGGFEDDEALTTMSFKDNLISFIGTSDESHSIPLFIALQKSTSGSSFSFDGRTLYYATDTNGSNRKYVTAGSGTTMSKINGVDLNIMCESTNFCMISDLNYASGAEVDINGTIFTFDSLKVDSDGNRATISADLNFVIASTEVTTGSDGSGVTYLEPFNTATPYKTMYLSDGNNTPGASGTTGGMGYPIELKGNNDVVFKYVAYTDSSGDGENIWLLLHNTTDFTPQYSKDIMFGGTSYLGATETCRPDTVMYWMDSLKFGGGSDTSYYTAIVSVDANEGSNYDLNLFYDTYDHKLVSLPNTQLTCPTVDVNYFGGKAPWQMDERSDTPSIPDKAYDDFGSKYVLADRELTITIPENIRRAMLIVSGEGVKETMTGAETLTLAEGESGTTATGTKILVSSVAYDATCGGDAGTCAATPAEYKAQAAVGSLVYLDTDLPTGKKVIVGGPIVNNLAAAIAGLADRLTVPGDKVAEVDASGDIVAAGYTAGDTGKAAQELIDAIDNL
ncbi:MAG: S-layer protein [Candidatus Diapherotrites archaeon]